MSDGRWWYTENEWSRLVGWGKLPEKYAKPKEPSSDWKAVGPDRVNKEVD